MLKVQQSSLSMGPKVIRKFCDNFRNEHIFSGRLTDVILFINNIIREFEKKEICNLTINNNRYTLRRNMCFFIY